MVKRLNQMFPDTYRHHIPTRFSETNKCPIRNKVTNPHCLDHQEEYLSLAVLHLERNNCYMRNFPIFFQSFFSLYKVPLRLFLLAWQVSHERPCLPDPPTNISVPPQIIIRTLKMPDRNTGSTNKSLYSFKNRISVTGSIPPISIYPPGNTIMSKMINK